MSSYGLSYEARQDYFDAFEFIAAYSSRAASKWEATMTEAVDHLASWPNSRRLHPEYGPDHIRFWIAEEYLILYDPTSDPLSIIGIVHGTQYLAPLIARRVGDYEDELDNPSN